MSYARLKATCLVYYNKLYYYTENLGLNLLAIWNFKTTALKSQCIEIGLLGHLNQHKLPLAGVL